MRSFLKLTWTVEQFETGKFYIREETTGAGERLNGLVYLGPCETREEATDLLPQRHRLMAEVLRDIRRDMEARLAECRSAA